MFSLWKVLRFDPFCVCYRADLTPAQLGQMKILIDQMMEDMKKYALYYVGESYIHS